MTAPAPRRGRVGGEASQANENGVATRYREVVKLQGDPDRDYGPVEVSTTRPLGSHAMRPDSTRLSGDCVECGREIIGRFRDRRKFCSVACRKECHARISGKTRTHQIGNQVACIWCGNEFVRRTWSHRFCSEDCLKSKQATKYELPVLAQDGSRLPTGTIGALTELQVCVDLMKRGYHVFRAMSPSCPCDLVVWRPEGATIRLEVKSAARNLVTGQIIRSDSSRNVFDAICYVTRDELIYEPPIEAW